MQQTILEVRDVVQTGAMAGVAALHTYIVRACGEGMTQAGIHDCDLLLVDRSELAAPGEIVVAALNGEALIRRLAIVDGSFALQAASDEYPTLKVEEGDELSIWGVVRQRLSGGDVAQGPRA
ncbi:MULTISPECIES: LexA family protein [Pseudomonadaceae]|uniref:S24 family peptidase n=1 Tax=Pseudomonas denitrificans TaxID=43306 RepID=A0A9X7R3V8_PSEDE|nr:MULTISPECIES: S24 family peptidase [Pseudomonadaceae]MBD9629725.1 S24 family peptidase [Pseudomonas sp. PDM19]QEY71871.1 S24 family peptidase [Pseudomonas denitrificans (nom. rej.)]